MSRDKGNILFDLGKIRDLLPAEQAKHFDHLIIQLYLYIIGSTHAANKPKRNLLYRLIKMARALQRSSLLRKTYTADIAVYIFDRNHLHQVMPVLKELEKAGKTFLFISYKQSLLNSEELAPYAKLLLPLPSMQPGLDRNDKALLESVKQIIATGNIKNITADDLPAIQQALYDWSAQVKQTEHFVQKLVPQIHCKAALIGYDVPPEGRIFTEVMNAQGVPTFMIQHGAMAKVDGIFSLHLVQHLMVFGEVARRTLQASGCRSHIHLAGSPYMDRKAAALNSRAVKRKGAQPKILVAFSGPGHLTDLEHHTHSIAMIMQLAAEMPNATFFIKLHPKDNASYYRALDAYNIHYSLVNNSTDIFDWLEHTDMLITSASTVAIEAMLLKRPVISLDLQHAYSELDFVKTGSVYVCRSYNELKQATEAIAQGNTDESIAQRADRFVHEFYGDTDGKAAERCAAIILDKIK